MGFPDFEGSALPEVVTQKLADLPAAPGCYIFRDKEGHVLYVGKAKSLKSRVRSYFQASSSDDRAFIAVLPRLIGDLETVVTRSEKEATILESNLIKESKPRFNVKLRDDKEYLNLKLNLKKQWPRLELVRRASTDGARYFGPYHSATSARRTLHLVEKHFQLRTCTDRELKSRSRPCIQYQIQRCPAPCVFEVDESAYSSQVSAVDLFLSGRHDELSQELKEKMKAASQTMEFELAALYRDQLNAVSQVKERQRVVSVTHKDQDILGLYRQGDIVELSVVYARQGRVVEISSVSHGRSELPDDEIVSSFLRQHYEEGGIGAALVPHEVIVPELPDAAEGIEQWLTERRTAIFAALPAESRARRVGSCKLLAPERGIKKKLLDLALENAAHAFAEKRRHIEGLDERLKVVQQKLRLSTLPRQIECCDISHLGGEATVGSVVAMTNGEPNKKRYKSYHVQTVKDGDDYEAMYEVLLRRFARGKASAEKSSSDSAAPEADFWALPDLFVVDGGRGQLGVALAAAADLGIQNMAIVGLAKERETVSGERMVDRVYLPGQKNPVSLRPNTPELFLLARARDEAHRFANVQRERLGKKRRFKSGLDDIPGIGPKTRVRLLKEFSTIDGVAQATDEQLLARGRVSQRQLTALREKLASS